MPTMRLGATEISTIYGQTTPSVGTWDFSIPNNDRYYASVNVDSTFTSKYVRSIDGLNRYTVENTFLPADARWASIIYNYTSGQWEEMYVATGNTCYDKSNPISCAQGWDIFETHYLQVGATCGAIPSISTSEFQVQNSDGSTNLVNTSQAFQHVYGDCFTGSPKPYVPVVNHANYQWTVTGGG